jgi:hypothetical protein
VGEEQLRVLGEVVRMLAEDARVLVCENVCRGRETHMLVEAGE